MGAVAISALAQLASWLGKPAAAARYQQAAGSIQAGLAGLLRYNGSEEAYAVDGAVGPEASEHAALHSSVYAAAAGVADGNASLARALGAFLARRDVLPSSCMTARWYVEASYRLGLYAAEPADYALQLLSRSTYPSWGFMLHSQNASMSLEAWAWEDKWNTDGGHPWCASPAFLIPRLTLGAQPLSPGWATWRVAPQPSSLSWLQAAVPTPQGFAELELWAASSSAAGNLTLSLSVPPGTAASVCLPLPGTAQQQQQLLQQLAAAASSALSDSLWVDGQRVASPSVWGRFLCAPEPLLPGAHTAARITAAL
jgi:hypothetical protein